MLNKKYKIGVYDGVVAKGLCIVSLLVCSAWANAQTVDQVRWKSESQVRETLGEPLSVTGPVGTHATYTMWKYDKFTVAFANSKAFHLFNTDSLKQYELNEGNEGQ